MVHPSRQRRAIGKSWIPLLLAVDKDREVIFENNIPLMKILLGLPACVDVRSLCPSKKDVIQSSMNKSHRLARRSLRYSLLLAQRRWIQIGQRQTPRDHLHIPTFSESRWLQDRSFAPPQCCPLTFELVPQTSQICPWWWRKITPLLILERHIPHRHTPPEPKGPVPCYNLTLSAGKKGNIHWQWIQPERIQGYSRSPLLWPK